MGLKRLIALAGGLVLTFSLFVVSAQEPNDDDVRGAFLSSRPKTTNANAPSRRHKPRNPDTANNNKRANSSTPSPVKNANAQTANANKATSWIDTKPGAQAIGLGYTLFMRDANGRSVRVEPSREFHNGDRVRISLEPNVDGYLYVFHTENNGLPEMIYPDARLESGGNWIAAHVPIEVPSSEETDERLRWFTFYGNSGIERLYIVVTRDPLNAVPTEQGLVAFCATNKDKCPWRPSPDVWALILDASKADVRVVTSSTFGQTETEREKVATTRGLGLDQSAPQPSVIRMNASTNAPLLVTVLDLIHK